MAIHGMLSDTQLKVSLLFPTSLVRNQIERNTTLHACRMSPSMNRLWSLQRYLQIGLSYSVFAARFFLNCSLFLQNTAHIAIPTVNWIQFRLHTNLFECESVWLIVNQCWLSGFSFTVTISVLTYGSLDDKVISFHSPQSKYCAGKMPEAVRDNISNNMLHSEKWIWRSEAQFKNIWKASCRLMPLLVAIPRVGKLQQITTLQS